MTTPALTGIGLIGGQTLDKALTSTGFPLKTLGQPWLISFTLRGPFSCGLFCNVLSCKSRAQMGREASRAKVDYASPAPRGWTRNNSPIGQAENLKTTTQIDRRSTDPSEW